MQPKIGMVTKGSKPSQTPYLSKEVIKYDLGLQEYERK